MRKGVWMMAVLASVSAGAAQADTALLAGGCFWCLEHDLKKVEGVTEVVSGYSGGTIENPTYQNYHDDIPGQEPHVEVVQVTYDPAVIGYAKLLDTYLRKIDPTDGGGQFCDRGAAYRPVIYVAGEGERAVAEERLAAAAKLLAQPLQVDVLPARTFWPAEEYHQEYADKNPTRYTYYRWRCGRDAKVKEVWQGR
ncbi:MAG: peptide-methionine (S)-S-oxide reductase MsrA [Pseudomonadaceae bacterium]|nr:peptide-methionine (S)-S-oxide reductase MsrA [Pseudomonadaceae bacterium]